MRTPNARPDRCELCDAALPIDGNGRHRYKIVLVWGRQRIPTGLRCCAPCHHDWLRPALVSTGSTQAGQQLQLITL